MSRWQWMLLQLTRQLWFRATLIGALGVVAAILATVAQRFLPWEIPFNVGVDAVDGILAILASSMLAVTTFSLSVMTAAYSAATSNVTPRATKLLMQDSVTQNVLSTFIGSFLFSIVGIVVLQTGAYGDQGRAVLFVVTVGVILLIVVALLRWINYLVRLGRVGETTDLVEKATCEALRTRLEHPCLGGRRSHEPQSGVPAGVTVIETAATGYVQHVDMKRLSECCDEAGADLVVAAVPGNFVYRGSCLAWLRGDLAEGAEARQALCEKIRKAFSIDTERSFDQDPRFGLIVLSEIALRALSPALNDPGTAIDVIGRNVRLLTLWAEGRNEPSYDDILYPRVHVPALSTADLFDDAFGLIARDGAARIEVQLRLRKALLALARMGDAAFQAAARHQAQLALERAESALATEHDRARLRALA